MFVRVEQRAGGRQEILTVGGQLDDARRARQQRLAEMRLQPLQLQADGRLGGAECIGGARGAGEGGLTGSGAAIASAVGAALGAPGIESLPLAPPVVLGIAGPAPRSVGDSRTAEARIS